MVSVSIEGKVHTLLSPPLTPSENPASEELMRNFANLHKPKTFGIKPKFPPFKGWENDK